MRDEDKVKILGGVNPSDMPKFPTLLDWAILRGADPELIEQIRASERRVKALSKLEEQLLEIEALRNLDQSPTKE